MLSYINLPLSSSTAMHLIVTRSSITSDYIFVLSVDELVDLPQGLYLL